MTKAPAARHLTGAKENALNHAEFYREYERREWLAVEIATGYKKQAREFYYVVSFYPDCAVVSISDQNNEVTERIIVDGAELDKESLEYNELMEEINSLETMTEKDILSLARERGYIINEAPMMEIGNTGVSRSGWSIGGVANRDEWMSAANSRLWKIQTEE